MTDDADDDSDGSPTRLIQGYPTDDGGPWGMSRIEAPAELTAEGTARAPHVDLSDANAEVAS